MTVDISPIYPLDLGGYLGDGWDIISTAATSSHSAVDEETNGRTFLVTIQKGTSVRVLGFEHFVKIDNDIEPEPYLASFVKNLAD